jgi:hypothetical protein
MEGLGFGITDQAVPFQDSTRARGRMLAPLPVPLL